jgi:hypothetical protein
MRCLVVVADIDEQTYYLPLIEAPDEETALKIAGNAYPNCVPVGMMDERDILYMLETIRSAEPDFRCKCQA